MRDDTVSLHLPESQATFSGAPLHGLPYKISHLAPCPTVYLVIYHVLEPLIICGAQEHESLQRAASEARVHAFKAFVLVAQVMKLLQR
jgi:hypothetical protein